MRSTPAFAAGSTTPAGITSRLSTPPCGTSTSFWLVPQRRTRGDTQLARSPEPVSAPEPVDYRERYATLFGHSLDICPACGGHLSTAHDGGASDHFPLLMITQSPEQAGGGK